MVSKHAKDKTWDTSDSDDEDQPDNSSSSPGLPDIPVDVDNQTPPDDDAGPADDDDDALNDLLDDLQEEVNAMGSVGEAGQAPCEYPDPVALTQQLLTVEDWC